MLCMCTWQEVPHQTPRCLCMVLAAHPEARTTVTKYCTGVTIQDIQDSRTGCGDWSADTAERKSSHSLICCASTYHSRPIVHASCRSNARGSAACCGHLRSSRRTRTPCTPYREQQVTLQHAHADTPRQRTRTPQESAPTMWLPQPAGSSGNRSWLAGSRCN
jgi:hypothetical protein